MRVQGWDPVLIISQILCLQAIHYLTLSFILPPLLSGLTTPSVLEYSGGSQTVAHIMDWREMAARPAISHGGGAWKKLRGAWAGGKNIGDGSKKDRPLEGEQGQGDGKDGKPAGWDYGVDRRRGWIIGLAWIAAAGVDIAPLYYLVRRPTHILDFSLTLVFNHLLLTTYYSKSFPTSFYWWVVQALGAILMIVFAEQLCVKREMSSDLEISWNPGAEEIELGDR